VADDERIKQDKSLAEHVTGRIEIHRPVVVIDMDDDGRYLYRLHISEADPQTNNPIIFGIILSDLVDHLAMAYHDLTGRDVRDVRAQLFKVMRDEERFKQKNPSRGEPRGITVMPKPS
jgi:hypothetical protein